MKKIIFLSVIFLLLFVPVNVFAENVPDWVKNVSEWWSQGNISEGEFLNAVKYLVENNIISIESDDKNNLLMDAAITENHWKIEHFKTELDFRSDGIVLLADTAEFQTLVKFLEYSSSTNIIISEQFLKDDLINRFIEFTNEDDLIDQMRILDKTGMEVIRINNINNTFVTVPDNELQNKNDRYYFHESLKLNPDEIYVSDIDLNEENKVIGIPHKPTLRIGTQIHDSEKTMLGVLIINYNMKPILDEYLSSKFCNVSIFDQNGIIISDSDETKLFGLQLGTDVSYYDLNPQFESEEENDLKWYYDQMNKKTIIHGETKSDDFDRYWHFVCELK